MDSSELSNTSNPRKSRKRIGRGMATGHGKTSGRGHKGQKSRAGFTSRPYFEGGQMPLSRRIPKRGFNHADRFPFACVNLDLLEKHFEANAEVTFDTLAAAGLVRETKGGIKILGRGELTKPLRITVNAVSESAKKKLEAVGGTVELIPVPKVDKKTKADATTA